MSDYSKLKVAELKDLVKERGITSTGLKVKQNFIDALEADDASNGGGGGDEDGTGRSEQPEEEAAAAAADEAGVAVEGDEETEQPDAAAQQTGSAEVADDSDPAGDTHENVNKRKRSPTPPVSEEVVHKKLKTAEEKADSDVVVKLPEDQTAQEDGAPNKPGGDDTAPQEDIEMKDSPTTGPPSKHPPTHGLYIRELVRPLQPNNLREHLLDIAQPADTSLSPATIDAFHLDKLRSHALVSFNSILAASRARTALHDKVWPDEPMRKPLWVDFVPYDKVQEWIDIEVQRGDMTRWEVVYDSSGLDTDGPVVASLQEVDAAHSGARKASASAQQTRPPPAGAGEGMPNAPSGPRRRSDQLQQPPTPVEPPKAAQSSFDSLDELYNFTEAKPKIYYQPVSQDLAQRRQEAFDRETSRDWTDADADPSAYAEGELRRYTFEDGDRLVDGGADFGLFGRRGRGGGFSRGGRGRGGGDHYRGGGGGFGPRWR